MSDIKANEPHPLLRSNYKPSCTSCARRGVTTRVKIKKSCAIKRKRNKRAKFDKAGGGRLSILSR